MPAPRPATEMRSGSLEPGWPSRARSAKTRYPARQPHTPPGLQRKRAAAALSQAGRAQSANTRYPACRLHTPPADRMYATDVRQTDVRQHHHLIPPGRGHNKWELKQSFCGRMPFLSPTSRNHSLDLILSLTTKTPEQGRDVTPFTSPL